MMAFIAYIVGIIVGYACHHTITLAAFGAFDGLLDWVWRRRKGSE